MKKTITIITSLLVAVGMTAQIIPGQNHNDLLKAKNDKISMSGDEALSHLMVNPNPHTSAVLNSKSLRAHYYAMNLSRSKSITRGVYWARVKLNLI